MQRNNIPVIFTYFIVLIAFTAVVLTVFQYLFLINSFKIFSKDYSTPIISLYPELEKESQIEQTSRILLKHKIFEDSGYSVSFYVKIASQNEKDTLLFYSTDKYLSSIYSNISLIDGKIETSRIEYIPPIITDNKINDNQWHHVFVTANYNEERIYIDEILQKSVWVNYLKIPDKWFVAEVNRELHEEKMVNLKDFIFINKDLAPGEFKIYQDFFLGENMPLYVLIITSFFVNFLTVAILLLVLIFLIKTTHPGTSLLSISNSIMLESILLILAVVSLRSGFGYQVSLLLLFVFLGRLSQEYNNILPGYLKNFINLPFVFLLTVYRLLKQTKMQESWQYVVSQEPEVYFCLVLFLGLLFSFNKYLFTNNLFWY